MDKPAAQEESVSTQDREAKLAELLVAIGKQQQHVVRHFDWEDIGPEDRTVWRLASELATILPAEGG